jgi:hypothetical protein
MESILAEESAGNNWESWSFSFMGSPYPSINLYEIIFN